MENKILIKNVEYLNEEEKKRVREILRKAYDKFEIKLKEIKLMEIHFKLYDKEGKKKKYSVNFRVISPKGLFEASYADWDLTKATHRVVEKVSNEIKKKLRKE